MGLLDELLTKMKETIRNHSRAGKVYINKERVPLQMNQTLGSLGPNAFFPGGWGIVEGMEDIKQKSVMIVGQDFGTQEYFDKCLKCKSDFDGTTFKNLRKILEGGINLKDCYFTNLLMGLRSDGKMKSQIFLNDEYKNSCVEFFHLQKSLINPKFIVIMGLAPFNYIAPSLKLNCCKSFSQVNSESEEHWKKKIIVIPHPCYWHNRKLRRFKKSYGTEKEIQHLINFYR